MTKKMKTLSRAEILAAEDLEILEHPVPAWGGIVRLREMGLKKKMAFGELSQSDDSAAIAAFLLCASVIDDQGQCVFQESDIEALSEKNPEIIGEICQKILELNKMNSAEGAEKN